MSAAVALVYLAMLPAWAAQVGVSPPPAKEVTLSHCLVSLINEAQVPAQEAGVLKTLDAVEGTQVKEGQILGQIDIAQVEIQKKGAVADELAAQEKATNDVDVRFAVASAEVAKAEYDKAMEANSKVHGSISAAEINRLKLTWRKGELQIEQSQVDHKVAKFTADSKAAEAENADNNIERRQIRAPLSGIVVQVNTHVGEWLKPGDPVLRIVQVEKLRIEAFLSSEKFDPEEVSDRPVVVEVKRAGGRHEKFTGKVVFVAPEAQAGGEYRIIASVENVKDKATGQWLLRPGMTADMTIHLKCDLFREPGAALTSAALGRR